MTSPDPKKRIFVGKITTTHGVKGLVKLLPFCENTSLLEGKLFTSDNPADTSTLTIALKNPSGKYILAAIEGITSPENAEKYKGPLYIPRDSLPEVDNKDEFYIEDLIGLTAKTFNHEDLLGTIINVDNFGAGDLIEIKPRDGKTPYYVPFHNDYVTSIDLEEGYIILRNTELFRMG